MSFDHDRIMRQRRRRQNEIRSPQFRARGGHSGMDKTDPWRTFVPPVLLHGASFETDESLMAERSARASRRPSISSFGFPDRTYFRLLSRAAHAWGTPESAALLPGITAHPPFSTYAACCHELVFFSAVRFTAASALRWN